MAVKNSWVGNFHHPDVTCVTTTCSGKRSKSATKHHTIDKQAFKTSPAYTTTIGTYKDHLITLIQQLQFLTMPSFRNIALLTVLVASQASISAAFIVPGGKSDTRIAREMVSQVPPGVDDIFQQYGEESRQYRRTVYSHEDWVRHRSSDRFARNLSTFTKSSIYRSLFKEVTATTTVASFVVLWNMLFGEYQDLQSITHNGLLHDSVIPILALPLAPFTLSSPSLGLLLGKLHTFSKETRQIPMVQIMSYNAAFFFCFLVFRTNTSYKRWDEARKNWGMNINHTRDLVRMGNAYYDRQARSPEQATEDLDRLALATWAFVRSMKRHLSPEWEDEAAFQKELKEKLPEQQAQSILDAAHRPNRALQDLSTAIENLPMHFMRRNEIQAAATIFEDNLGSSERLLTSPIPVFYSRHTARFLSFWLLLLPFGLWGPLGNTWNHIGLIPTISMLSIFLFGIEELATQLEEPFTILPMQAFCDKIYNWCKEIVGFKPGQDNGMPQYYYDNYKMDTDNVKMVASENGAPIYQFETDQPLQNDIPEIEQPDLYTVAYEAAMAAASAALSLTMGGKEEAATPRATDPYAAPAAYTPPPAQPADYTPPPADSYTSQYDSVMTQAAAEPELLQELENAQDVTTETTVTTTTTSNTSYGTSSYLDNLNRNNLS